MLRQIASWIPYEVPLPCTIKIRVLPKLKEAAEIVLSLLSLMMILAAAEGDLHEPLSLNAFGGGGNHLTMIWGRGR